MHLSATSSIIIDLLLLTDAAEVQDRPEIVRLARRVGKTAVDSGATAIATHAKAVELMAASDTPCSGLTGAVGRLLAESEREIHAATSEEPAAKRR